MKKRTFDFVIKSESPFKFNLSASFIAVPPFISLSTLLTAIYVPVQR